MARKITAKAKGKSVAKKSTRKVKPASPRGMARKSPMAWNEGA